MEEQLSTAKAPWLCPENKIANGGDATSFALFICLYYMVPLSIDYTASFAYGWLLVTRGIGALLCIGLMLKELWPESIVGYFPRFYQFSLFYCLPFVATFVFLLEGATVEGVLNITLSSMLLIVLADWLTFVLFSIGGGLLAIATYLLLLGSPMPLLDFDTVYTLTYAAIFTTSIGLLFVRRKQQTFNVLVTERDRLTIADSATQEAL